MSLGLFSVVKASSHECYLAMVSIYYHFMMTY